MIETDVQFSWSGGGCLCAALMIKRTLVDCSHDREESAGQFSRSRGHWWTVLKIERTLVDTGHHHHVLSIDQESSLPVSSWSWELSTRHVCSSHNREDYNWLLSWSRGRWWTALLIKVCSSHDRVDTAAGVQLSWSRGHCSWCAALMIERTLLVCSSHDREDITGVKLSWSRGLFGLFDGNGTLCCVLVTWLTFIKEVWPLFHELMCGPHHAEGQFNPNPMNKKNVTAFGYPGPGACRFRKN
jgi:hypothetical protein